MSPKKRLGMLLILVCSLMSAQVLPTSARVLTNARLHHALSIGVMSRFREALELGADPNSESPSGMNPLGRCCFIAEEQPFAVVLLEAGARPDSRVQIHGRRLPLLALAILCEKDDLANLLIGKMSSTKKKKVAREIRVLLRSDGPVELPSALRPDIESVLQQVVQKLETLS